MKIKANFDHILWNDYNMLLYVSYYEIFMCYYMSNTMKWLYVIICLILWNCYMLLSV